MKRPLPHRPLDERVFPMHRLISSLKDCTLVLTLSSNEKQTNKYRCSRVKQYTSTEETKMKLAFTEGLCLLPLCYTIPFKLDSSNHQW